MIRSSVEMVRADWAAGNVKDMKQVSGDVVWSDEKQAGYMRLRGLPANDGTKETYQLWIFDKTQDKTTPIDGGTFDVPEDGEIIIPINAKLKADDPEMFAITIEKPGGVVVSKREKIAALAKVETPAA
jgi:anti-sigma-K factor RskA